MTKAKSVNLRMYIVFIVFKIITIITIFLLLSRLLYGFLLELSSFFGCELNKASKKKY